MVSRATPADVDEVVALLQANEAPRGNGVARMLYERLKSELPGREGILFVRKDNTASLRAHLRLPGMEQRGEFSADGVTFVVVSYSA